MWDAIEVETKKIKGAFKFYVRYQNINSRFVFEIKVRENFRRKARLIVDGDSTE